MKCTLCKGKGTEVLTKVVYGRITEYPVCLRCKPILEKQLEDGVLPKGADKK